MNRFTRHSCLVSLLFSFQSFLHAQTGSVGIGTATPNASAALEVSSTTRGMLIPRMTSTQRQAIAPVNGLLLYDTDSAAIFIYSNSAWKKLRSINALSDIIAGSNSGDMLVWNGSAWELNSKCNLFTYYYRDKDGDGHGDKYSPVMGCAPLPGFVTDSLDCDDNNAAAFQGSTEICDGIDNNCNGQVDEGFSPTPDAPDDAFADTNCDGIDGTAASAVFVATNGFDGNAGTRQQPLASINAGIAKAVSEGKTQVYVSMGIYNEKVVLSNGISLYGGYNATNNWQRAAGNTTTIFHSTVSSGRLIAVQGNDITANTTIDRFTITTGNTSEAGVSNYAVYCNNCTRISIRNCEISSGNAGPGSNGTDGTPGAKGNDGTNGGDGLCDGQGPGAGGAGAVAGSCTNAGGNGGTGGLRSAAGISGVQGGGSGGAGGTGGSTGNPGVRGTDGTDGANGTAGINGSAGNNTGSVSAGFWTASLSSSGGTGQPGKGGGGGGGGGGQDCTQCTEGTGNGGGGGGSGGCGGTGGSAGMGGGGSFGVFLSFSSPVSTPTFSVSSCIIGRGNGGKGGNAGNGGAGGKGGFGGDGGAACTSEVGRGGPGGKGGDGGNGGPGGGGPGGISYGLYLYNYSGSTASLVNNTFAPGGSGGAGGASAGNAGPAGASSARNF